jgi:hypothetical protein
VKKKEFFSRTRSYTKYSLMVYTGITVWEIQADLYNSFFRFENSGISCFSHQLWAQITRRWRGILKN